MAVTASAEVIVSHRNSRSAHKIAPLLLLLLAGGVIAATFPLWLPWVKESTDQFSGGPPIPSGQNAELAGHDHAGHSHAGHGHHERHSITLSAGALKNIGFRPLTLERSTFVKTISLPAMVIERPGRSRIQITAPLTGTITRIFPIAGAAIEPGDPMFEIRLTHEELVGSQSNLLRTAENLDVVKREIQRLKSLGEGVVAGKRILEQEYEQQKLEASLRAEQQALLLHGLNQDQVDKILAERTLFQLQTVHAPMHTDQSEACGDDHLFHVQELPVTLGQQVESGERLCVLADHCELYIEGRAFEDDAARLREAARHGWAISASLVVGEQRTEAIEGLKLLYLADHVDPQSRAFRFYISLPNQVVLDQTSPEGVRFLDWRFKPGQRMELRVPVEELAGRIVLPVEGVVDDGAETYVYRQNGSHFDQVAVHVEYRDQQSVVIASDGAVFPGDVVASRGAYQMHLALKNQAGGGIDPHAGHNH